MKHFSTALGWISVILFGVLFFVYLFQKEQNSHDAKMMDMEFEAAKIRQNSSCIIDLKDESATARIKERLKSLCVFIVSVVSKLF